MKRSNDNKRAQKLYTRRANGTLKVSTINEEPSLTNQQFLQESDVNYIVAKHKATGTVTHVRNVVEGVYADLTQTPVDLHEAQSIVLQAEQAFLEVPAQIRQRFGHDPKQFFDFIHDPNNKDEAIKLGLIVPPTPAPADPILTELQTLNKNLNKKPKPTPTP